MKAEQLDDRPQVAFDHHTEEHAADVHCSFRRARDTGTVAYTDSHDGFWVVTGYDEVAAAARDVDTFSTVPDANGIVSTSIPGVPSPYPKAPLQLDGELFTATRRLVAPMMTPRAAKSMENGMEYYAAFFLDRVIERGAMDLTADFATPIPSSVTLDWIGLESERWWHFFADRFHAQQSNPPGSPGFEGAVRGLDEIAEVFRVELKERRGNPREDVLSLIANATVAGSLIPEDLALGTAAFVTSGGVSTTAILTSHALVYLADHPETHPRLIEDDAFMRSATDEFIRYVTPVLNTSRRVSTECELGGQELAEGDRVLLAWAAANREERVFPEADTVVLDRRPNPHLGFGGGPHRCVGSNLARSMFKVMIRQVLERIPDFRVVDVVPARNRGIDHSFERVDIEFTPGDRVLPEGPPHRQFSTITGA